VNANTKTRTKVNPDEYINDAIKNVYAADQRIFAMGQDPKNGMALKVAMVDMLENTVVGFEIINVKPLKDGSKSKYLQMIDEYKASEEYTSIAADFDKAYRLATFKFKLILNAIKRGSMRDVELEA
jgi:hypothetical protein